MDDFATTAPRFLRSTTWVLAGFLALFPTFFAIAPSAESGSIRVADVTAAATNCNSVKKRARKGFMYSTPDNDVALEWSIEVMKKTSNIKRL
ncbi:hypothetical protein B0E41_05470 [Hydrogenophaga sp. A37]|nr:hypothetical protein B0E41_05470 [Hydrogenophaga sp. A37]